MSTYTNLTLQPGERIVVIARLHWVIYGWAMFYGGLALSVGVAGLLTTGLSRPLVFTVISVLAVQAARHAAVAWWRQLTTEITVTNRRVIYKRGFVGRPHRCHIGGPAGGGAGRGSAGQASELPVLHRR